MMKVLQRIKLIVLITCACASVGFSITQVENVASYGRQLVPRRRLAVLDEFQENLFLPHTIEKAEDLKGNSKDLRVGLLPDSFKWDDPAQHTSNPPAFVPMSWRGQPNDLNFKVSKSKDDKKKKKKKAKPHFPTSSPYSTYDPSSPSPTVPTTSQESYHPTTSVYPTTPIVFEKKMSPKNGPKDMKKQKKKGMGKKEIGKSKKKKDHGKSKKGKDFGHRPTSSPTSYNVLTPTRITMFPISASPYLSYAPTGSSAEPAHPTSSPHVGMPSAKPFGGTPTTRPAGVSSYKPSAAPSKPVLSVALAPFGLLYSMRQTRLPTFAEVATVGMMTGSYLDEFFVMQISDLKTLAAEVTGTRFTLFQPFRMNYTVSAEFLPGTSLIPSPEVLNSFVNLAFTGDNLKKYMGLLKALPASNIFSTTTDVSFEGTATRILPISNDTSGGGTGGADSSTNGDGGNRRRPIVFAAFGVGFLAFLVTTAAWRRREQSYSEVDKPDVNGQFTVAGETFLGTSTTYTDAEQGRNMTRSSQIVHDSQAVASDLGSVVGDAPVNRLSEQQCLQSMTEDVPLQFSSELLASMMLNPIEELNTHDDGSGDSATMESSSYIQAGNESEDEDVPLRVVDLIKRFSPQLSYAAMAHLRK